MVVAETPQRVGKSDSGAAAKFWPSAIYSRVAFGEVDPPLRLRKVEFPPWQLISGLAQEQD
jgi:hypothetical protein